jgi:hypothetical protein
MGEFLKRGKAVQQWCTRLNSQCRKQDLRDTHRQSAPVGQGAESAQLPESAMALNKKPFVNSSDD